MLSDKRKKYVIRSLRKGETELLKDFLYEAIFISEGLEVRNPYCYVDDGVIVKVSFSNTKETIEDRLEAYIRSM